MHGPLNVKFEKKSNVKFLFTNRCTIY